MNIIPTPIETIHGETVQNGIPTPENPVMPVSLNGFERKMTNGDRIRKMPDEELAVFMVIRAIMGAISVNGIQDKAAANKIVKEIIMDHKADEDISDALRWLKQEVQENDECR